MADLSIPATIGERLTELERRLRNLERSPQLGNASITNGLLTIKASNGTVIARIGDFPDGGTGLRAGSFPTGSQFDTFLNVTGDGLALPHTTAQWAKPLDTVTITTGAFATGVCYTARVEAVSYPELTATVTATSDAATTGEYRLLHVESGNATSAISVPAASTGTTNTFKWDLVGFLAAGSGPATIQLQARRLTGAGNIYILPPTTLTLGRVPGATPTG